MSTAGGGEGHNREGCRARKRLMVRYGVDKTRKTGFTKDVSETGMFIKTNQVLKPGTTMQVDIHTPTGVLSLWGTVVWAKKVPVQLAHILECGMGVRFTDPGAEWIEFCREWSGSGAGK